MDGRKGVNNIGGGRLAVGIVGPSKHPDYTTYPRALLSPNALQVGRFLGSLFAFVFKK